MILIPVGKPPIQISVSLTQNRVPFPKNFQQVRTKILTRLFRVFVHVYIHHFDGIIAMGTEAHVNTCYKHFYYFIQEFSLMDHQELEPLMASWLIGHVWVLDLEALSGCGIGCHHAPSVFCLGPWSWAPHPVSLNQSTL
ncbi:MOB kinase activator 3C-like [Sminthopsis crassicaudata]|uniref:MOB kinase activator 3C-like n=1 Tax=Sminthopsis crassicaudata TaxID=9301 RepID=UPI003D69DCD8